MYSSLMMLVAILAPIPTIINSVKQRVTPFRAVLNGLLTGAVGALVIMVIADFAGNNVFDELFQTVNMMTEMMAKDSATAEMLGLAGASEAEMQNILNEVYSTAIKLIPSVVFIMATIASYIEYIIISKVYKPGGIAAIPMTKLREFDLPRNFAIIWLVIYLASMLITASGIFENDMIFMNINYLFNFAFCLQGISLIFMICYSKRIPQALAVLIIVVAWFTNLGQTILMIIGFTDILFNVKQRFRKIA